MSAHATTKVRKNSTAFSFVKPAAQSVMLVGTFNQWDPAATPMANDGKGVWTVSLDLPPGRYEYKFLVDGQWCCEPGVDDHDLQCGGCVLNDYGTQNRVIEVE